MTGRKAFRKPVMQRLESRHLLAGDVGYCVPSLPAEAAPLAPPAPTGMAPLSMAAEAEVQAVGQAPFDPSGDAFVTPLDALLVLTHIASVQRGTEVPTAESLRRFDVDRDGLVTPSDALQVITAIAQARRAGFASISVPRVSLLNGAAVDSVLSDLSFRLDLVSAVQAVFAAVDNQTAGMISSDISDLRQGDSLVLPHEELLARLGPIDDGPVELAFWTDDPGRAIRTHVRVDYRAAPAGPRPDRILWTENAEHGTARIIDRTAASYPLIQSAVTSEGANAFHLAHPVPSANWFELDRTLTAEEDTKLFFMSRLGWAAEGQVAEVQLSTDGGTSWPHTIFSQAGTGSSGEGGFGLQEVDLSAFANQDIRIRFIYQYKFGSYYPQTDPGFAWYVDNIQIGNTLEKSRYEIGNPSAHQQQYLEYVNRARADALVEAQRLAGETDPQITAAYASFGINPNDIVFQYTQQVNSGEIARHAQPLSFNASLLAAAQLHTQDLFTNRFQGHTSSANPPAPFQPGMGPTARAAAVGYIGGVAENVFSYAQSVVQGHTAFAVDWGGESPGHPNYNPLFAGQGMQNPAGHRLNIHDNRYKEFGVGVINDTNGSVGPQLVTQKFGPAGNITLITGVVYEDLNGNGFYDIGEGRAGVRVDVDGSGFYAISTDSGGYSVPVSGDGQYTVTFSGGGHATEVMLGEVITGNNLKIDYLV